jgi:hypothetical protein
MGMDFGDGPDLDAIHEERMEASKNKDEMKEVSKEPSYTIISCISLNGVDHQLLVGEDHRWYKAKKIGEYRRDEKNRSPLIPIFGEVEPFSEEDKKYFM